MRVRPWAQERRSTLVLDVATLLAVALVYVVVVLGGGLLIGSTESPNIGLSVLATALVALGLERFRGFLSPYVARRLDHGRQSPYDVLSGFTESLSYPVDRHGPLDLPTRLARHLATGTGAAEAQVWLAMGEAYESVGSWPPADGQEGSSADERGRVHARDVALDDVVIGTLRVRERLDQPFGPVEERLLADLAAQAGIVLHRVQLRTELARRATDLALRAEELQESRRRVVDAHDAERRRLERDIHDGAQQHLVALVVNLRLAQTLIGRAPDRASAVLAEQVDAVDDAITALGDLSRGIYPHALVEEGVGAALRSLLGTMAAPITVRDRGLGRLPEEIEAALYFCAVEAVQNAVKHAGATAIRVDLTETDGNVRLEVTDDGAGLDPSNNRAGRGMGNMRDRIDAVGGRLTLRSSPGAGLAVVATVPVAVGVEP